MKIKIFTEHDEPRYSNGNCIVSLEKRINNFIKNKRVIDIKYQISDTDDPISGFSERALVIYEDQQDMSSYKFIDVIDDESEDKKCPYCDLKKDLYERSFLDTRGIPDNGPYFMSIMDDFGAGRFIMAKVPSKNGSSERGSILIHYCPMCGRKL